MLNPSLALPLYQQLADELAAGLQKGDYAVGARIPSEHELAQRYRLGRPTVRQATEVLVRRGLLERRRGAGTFVSTPREAVDLFTLSGTLAAFEGLGLTLRTRLVEPVRLRDVAKQPGNPFRACAPTHSSDWGGLTALPRSSSIFFWTPKFFRRSTSYRWREPRSRVLSKSATRFDLLAEGRPFEWSRPFRGAPSWALPGPRPFWWCAGGSISRMPPRRSTPR